MKVAPINADTNVNYLKRTEVKNEPKPIIDLSNDIEDSAVVAYSDWGGMAIPVTAGQIKSAVAIEKVQEAYQNVKEPDAEYYNRKLFSTDWFM